MNTPRTPRRCERSGDHLKPGCNEGDRSVGILGFTPAETNGLAVCGTCNARLYTATRDNQPVRLPEHQQGQQDWDDSVHPLDPTQYHAAYTRRR